MLDTETDLVHFFRKSSDSEPYQSLSLNGGVLTDDNDSDVVDEQTGQRLPTFKFQFMNKKGAKKGSQLTVVPEQGFNEVMVRAFQKGTESKINLTTGMMSKSSKMAGEE